MTSKRRRVRWWRLAEAGAGAAAARTALTTLRRYAPPQWQRPNFRGRTVSLASGPALAVAASVAAAAAAPHPGVGAAALSAGLGAGGVGFYDDLVSQRPTHRAKGFRGHLRALGSGQVTSGFVKVVGVGATGLVAVVLLERARDSRCVPNIVWGAGLVAGSANLLNLLDLRPGRALKVGMLAGAGLSTGAAGGLGAGPAGACAALLPDDLAERTMLGDSGANALGALLGVALAARTGPVGRATACGVIAALTVASEKISFTRVIARTPILRELDNLGRRPDQPPQG